MTDRQMDAHMSEQKQAMPPERIWVFGRQHTRNKALGKAFRGDEYILAADPAVMALVAFMDDCSDGNVDRIERTAEARAWLACMENRRCG